ncbi:MAG: hypothetical protein ACPGPF_03040, partial [Pontibacterium sp.]
DQISSLGRNTQGVTLIRVIEDEHLVGLARIEEPDEELVDSEEGEVTTENPSEVTATEAESPVNPQGE